MQYRRLLLPQCWPNDCTYSATLPLAPLSHPHLLPINMLPSFRVTLKLFFPNMKFQKYFPNMSFLIISNSKTQITLRCTSLTLLLKFLRRAGAAAILLSFGILNSTLSKVSFFNYVYYILPIIDHLPTPSWHLSFNVIRENLHTINISSTTYLPCLVNIVKEWPLTKSRSRLYGKIR